MAGIKRNTAARPQPASELQERLQAEITRRNLPLKGAAAEIGVTLGTLQNHLAGGHIRSDSARKYENWIEGRPAPQTVFRQNQRMPSRVVGDSEPFGVPLPAPPAHPYLVVDIFAGCGGLSLGFDLLGNGKYFETALAIDIQSSTVEVMNRNHPSRLGGGPVAREADLTEFMNETEILCFYLDHVCRRFDDRSTRHRLDQIGERTLPRFLGRLSAINARFVDTLAQARRTPEFLAALERLDKQSLLQTSVVGFHDELKLPRTGRGKPTLPTVLWGDVTAAECVPDADAFAPRAELRQLYT